MTTDPIALPDPTDPVPWVHHLARTGYAAGGSPYAEVVAFEDDEPTLVVRPSVRHDLGTGTVEALGILGLLGVRHVVAGQPLRMCEPGSTGMRRDLDSRLAMLVTTAATDGDGGATVTATLLPFTLDDRGLPVWDEPEPLDEDGPVGAAARRAVTGQPVPPGQRAGLAYAAERLGLGLGVAVGWRTHYGFDGPLDHREVRREDRRRARAHDALVAGGVR